ncbi:MAG: acyltransferase, partial [Xanthomonadales bacterium]|nr:acyltransferase [Xanthomonadales bacterium]
MQFRSELDNKRPDLQGLRAIAVIAVVLFHIAPNVVPAGYIGVDAFFVLSGYLITGLLLRERLTSGRLAVLSFYARRIKRLLPAMLVMIAVTQLASWVWLSPGEQDQVAGSAPYAALWISNFYFAWNSTSYFNELANQDLFLHTWSLDVEEQFYLLWPAGLLLLFGLTRLNPRRSLLVGMAVALIISLIYSVAYTQINPTSAFFLLPARIWEFAAGSMIAIHFATTRSVNVSHRSIIRAS